MKLTIEEMHGIAEARGGRCLSTKYINTNTHLFWQCAEQHQWSAVPASVKRGSWCRVCDREKKRPAIVELEGLAQQFGGKLLLPPAGATANKALWTCAYGHRWLATPTSVRAGTRCVDCYHDSMRKALTDLQEIAASRGGRCLATSYLNAKVYLEWECQEGHRWLAKAVTVSTSWCPACSFERKRLGIERMRALAAGHGGYCISEAYKNNRSPLTWRCLKGHEWESRPQNVIRGQWCPECRRIDQEMQLESSRSRRQIRFSVPLLV